MRVRRITAMAAGAVAALAIGGAALAAGGDDDRSVPLLPNGDVAGASPRPTFSPAPSESPSGAATRSPSGAPATSASGATGIGVATAKAIALRATGGGRVTEVERETEHGRAVFEIEVYASGAEHDLQIDRVTGDVTRHRVRADRGGDDRLSGDRGGDDRGRGGHGSDDRGGDDRGRGGHGSDD